MQPVRKTWLASIVFLLGLSSAWCQETASQLQDTKQVLELGKLRAEITKLEDDNRYAFVSNLAPAVAVGSGIIAAIALFVQRKTALGIQRNTERANLELKALEFVLNSPTPYIGAQKLAFVQRVYKHLLSKQFLEATEELNPRQDLPGTRLYEIKLEFFKQLAAKATTADEVLAAGSAIFPADDGRIIEQPERLMRSAEPKAPGDGSAKA